MPTGAEMPHVEAAASSTAFDHQHQRFALVLKEFVDVSGPMSTVRYAALKRDSADLDTYLDSISGVSKEEYQAFTRDQQLAFLINAYNAYTLKLIINHYPVKSIKDIGGTFSSPWKKRFFTLLGKKRHLDDIEHGMIREDFDEPRIHFAVNCASKGCPALLGEPFRAASLDDQLEVAAELFLGDSSRNRFDADASTLYLSKILKWYGSDFTKDGGTVAGFVADRLGVDDAARTAIRQARLAYLDYDWALNE